MTLPASGSVAANLKTRLWHPFADMHTVQGRELVIDRAEGVWLYDEDGKRYLDATAALWYANVGHGRREIADAVAEQMKRLAGYQIFDVFANRPALALAERLTQLAPLGEGSVTFFTSGGGSDAIDTAAKIARRYWIVRGEPDRKIIIARSGAYHGMNGYGTSLAGIEPNHSGWGPLMGDIVHIDRFDLEGLERVLQENQGAVAAFVGEPVQGAAGVFPPVDGYWEGVQDLLKAHGVLLIADEVITGYGRTGNWFGSERYDLDADLIVTAKGLSSGYTPIGAVIASERVREVLWSEESGPFRHGYTYSGHPAACAGALKNLEIIEREGLVERVAALEPVFAAKVRELAGHPLVEEVRTAGLLAGVEISGDARAARPGLVEEISVKARELGVIVRPLVGHSLQISPPFVITEEQIDELVEVLGRALDSSHR